MTYDRETALIVVDVQNDFADPEGSLYVAEGETIVPLINAEIDRSLSADGKVFYTQDWHPASTPHFEKDGGTWPVHCVRDTWGAELHPHLQVEGEVVRKGTGGEDGYSGFTVRDPSSGAEDSTRLEDLLRSAGITKVTVVGLATDYCVKETALDALRKGFETRVPAATTRAVNLDPGDGHKALEDLRHGGATVT